MDTERNLPVTPSPADLAAIQHLTAEEIAQARAIARDFDPTSGSAVLEFAVSPQKRLADLADPILQQIRAKDAGAAAEPLNELMTRVKEINADALGTQAESFLAGLPLIGRGFRRARQFIARYEKVSARIDHLTDELKGARQKLLLDVTRLDRLFEQNTVTFKETLVFIHAGELKLREIEAEQRQLQDEAAESGNLTTAQRAQDLGALIVRLERRIHDLKLTAMISLQMAPQIRLIQSSDQALVEKIQSSILTTIPLWKNQIVLSIGLFNQKKALELQRAVTDTTNELLARNARMLQQGVTDIARESERGIVELATLQEVNDRLIATIEETLQIQAEGRRKRGEAEGQLHEMQVRLRDALVAPRFPRSNAE